MGKLLYDIAKYAREHDWIMRIFDWIADHPRWFLFFFLVLLITLFLTLRSWYRRAKERLVNYIDLRTTPSVIQPIASIHIEDYLTRIPKKTEPVPTIDNSFWTVGENHKELKTYFQYLEASSIQANAVASEAYSEFESRYLVLRNNQKQLLRRIFHAQTYINPYLTGLRQLNLSIENLPSQLEISVPEKPDVLKPSDISKKYGLLINQAATVAGKILAQNGVNSTNIFAAAVILMGSILHGQANVSKLKRASEDAYGSVSNYLKELSLSLTQLALLDESHIVSTSQKLKQAESNIITLIEKVKAIPVNVDGLSGLSEGERQSISQLYLLVLTLNGLTQKRIV